MDDGALIDRLRTAVDVDAARLQVPAGFTATVRLGALRRRARRRAAVVCAAAALVAMGTGVAVLAGPGVDRVAPVAAAPGVRVPDVDGVRVGWLPPGYRQVAAEPVADPDGERMSSATYRAGTGSAHTAHAAGDITVDVWRVLPRDPSITIVNKPSESETFPLPLRSADDPVVLVRTIELNHLVSATVTGAGIDATVVERVAQSLTDVNQ